MHPWYCDPAWRYISRDHRVRGSRHYRDWSHRYNRTDGWSLAHQAWKFSELYPFSLHRLKYDRWMTSSTSPSSSQWWVLHSHIVERDSLNSKARSGNSQSHSRPRESSQSDSSPAKISPHRYCSVRVSGDHPREIRKSHSPPYLGNTENRKIHHHA